MGLPTARATSGTMRQRGGVRTGAARRRASSARWGPGCLLKDAECAGIVRRAPTAHLLQQHAARRVPISAHHP